MLQPECLSASDWNAFASGAQRAARHWVTGPTKAGDPPLLVLIEGCLECPESTLAAAKPLLSSTELDHTARLRQRLDQVHHLLARAGLRLLLAALSGTPAHTFAIARSASGKPFLVQAAGAQPPPEFNIAHSHDLVLIGVHRTAPIGVDLEAHRPLPDGLAIARRCFDLTTLHQLAALSGAEQLRAFYGAWCQLEADRKATGHGLTQSPSDQTIFSRHRIIMPTGYSGAASLVVRDSQLHPWRG